MAEAVRYYPCPNTKCNYPETFAVLEDNTNLDSSNLTKRFVDFDKGFFFSRAWEARNRDPNQVTFDYPVVGAKYYASTLNSIKAKTIQVKDNVTLGCYDVLQNNCKPDCCGERAKHEIERECLETLINVISYLNNVVVAEIDGSINYYNTWWLEKFAQEGGEYKKLQPAQLFVNQDNIYTYKAETGIDHIYGMEIRLDLRTQICADSDYICGTVEHPTLGYTCSNGFRLIDDQNPTLGGDLNLNGFKIVNIPDPTDPTDLVTLGWLLSQGLSGDKNFEFNQPTPSAVWNINHNLQKYPSPIIIDSAGDEVEGLIKHIDKNNISITFSAPFTGKATLN